MSPDKRPELVFSRRKFVGGAATTFLLAACGPTAPVVSKASLQEVTPVPVVIPIRLSDAITEVTPVIQGPEQNLSIKQDPLVPTLKTQLAVAQAVIDVYKEPTKVPLPTRTSAVVKPAVAPKPTEVVVPTAVKPSTSVSLGKDDVRTQAFPTWLNELTKNRGSIGNASVSQLSMANYFKGNIFDNKGIGVLDPITPQEVIQRFDRNKELNLSFIWMTQDFSGQGLNALFRTVSGFAEINRASITQLIPAAVSPADLSNGIDWNGLLMMQVAYRAKYAVVSTRQSVVDIRYPSDPLKSPWSNDILTFRLQHSRSGWGFVESRTLQEKVEYTMLGFAEYPLSVIRVGDANRQSNLFSCIEVGKVCNVVQ